MNNNTVGRWKEAIRKAGTPSFETDGLCVWCRLRGSGCSST